MGLRDSLGFNLFNEYERSKLWLLATTFFADFAFEIVKLLINQHRFWFISNAKSVVNDLHETSFISKWINAKNVVAKCLDLSYPTN